MAYTPYTVEGFGGLNVRDDPEQVDAGGAIDLSNVIIDGSGVLRPRPGYATFGSSPSGIGTSTGCLLVHMHTMQSSLSPFFTVVSQDGTATKAWVIMEDGTTSASASLGSASGWVNFTPSYLTDSFAHVATAAGIYRIEPNSPTSSSPSLVKLDGLPRYVGRTAASNRLVQANYASASDSPSGSNGDPSVLFFSDPRAPGTWTSSNWVPVGEAITGLVSWDEQLFVLGAHSLFVFYGESTDSTGGVIFNYRPVQLNAGRLIQGTVGQASCAGPDGVYFATSQGIWRTQGGPAVKVSTSIDPVFTGDFFGSGVATVDKVSRMTCVGQRVFVSCELDSTTNGLTLVYDVPTGQWFRWDIGKGSAPIARNDSARDDDIYYFDTTAKKAMQFDPDLATDNGSSMSWRYQSGWYDLGSPERKVIRESLLWGTGSPTYGLLTDYATTDASAAAVTLGTSPTVAEGRQRIARRGVFFSHKLSGAGAASVSRLTHHLTSSYRPGADPS